MTAIAHAPQTGDELVKQFRDRFPAELADVPSDVFRALAHVTDEALNDARNRGNAPRHPIAEDGKRGGKTLPKR